MTVYRLECGRKSFEGVRVGRSLGFFSFRKNVVYVDDVYVLNVDDRFARSRKLENHSLLERRNVFVSKSSFVSEVISTEPYDLYRQRFVLAYGACTQHVLFEKMCVNTIIYCTVTTLLAFSPHQPTLQIGIHVYRRLLIILLGTIVIWTLRHCSRETEHITFAVPLLYTR